MNLHHFLTMHFRSPHGFARFGTIEFSKLPRCCVVGFSKKNNFFLTIFPSSLSSPAPFQNAKFNFLIVSSPRLWVSLASDAYLVTRPKYLPTIARHVYQYPCHTVFPVVPQTIAATPHTSFLKNAYCSAMTGLTRGASQKKLASEAYRAIGGVARNSTLKTLNLRCKIPWPFSSRKPPALTSINPENRALTPK